MAEAYKLCGGARGMANGNINVINVRLKLISLKTEINNNGVGASRRAAPRPAAPAWRTAQHRVGRCMWYVKEIVVGRSDVRCGGGGDGDDMI